jgi:predicted DNA-binding transcriptional regulator AlpA
MHVLGHGRSLCFLPLTNRRPAQINPLPHSVMPPRKSQLRLPADVPDDAVLLDVQQLAATLSVSINTVRRWREQGKLPPSINLFGRVRWRRADVLKFIESFGDS